ncbi:NERD domain-containing protein [Anaerobacillus sp. HL2]|nr:NERD domain-containing protein [Anaerobacillus sp. HL2]
MDHIIISVNGLFVIETKNYKGWIFGDDSATMETSNL